MTSGLSGLWDDLYAEGPPTAGNPPRRVVILLLDTSASMRIPSDADHRGAIAPMRPIDLLNDQLRDWLPRVRAAGHRELRDVEVAVLTFGGQGVRAITRDASGPAGADDRAFVPAADLYLDDLTAGGTGHMVAAVGRALDLGEARVRYLAARNVRSEPVRIMVFGDGSRHDNDLPADAWPALLARLGALRERRRVQVFAFGPPGADESALTALADDRGYLRLAGFDFERLLDLVFRATSAEDPMAALSREFGFREPPA